MLRTKEQMYKRFYAWVYSAYPVEKFNLELTKEWTTHPSLMHKWHNYISPAQFALYMEQYGEPYNESKAIANEIIAKKKMEEMLGL